MPLDRPDRFEILSAVETLLDRDVKPRLEGPLGFELRIAIHLLRLLRRELEASTGFDADERARLEVLLPGIDPAIEAEAVNAELCARIRDGRIAYDDPALRAHLRATVMAKVAIDQPKYPTYVARLGRGKMPND